MWKIATTSMSVFWNLDCLSLVVCSNTTRLKLQTVLFLFFSKFCASKSGVRLIYGCGLYTDVYGTFSNLGKSKTKNPRLEGHICITKFNMGNMKLQGPFHFLSAPPLLKGYYRTPLRNNFQHMHPLRNLGWHLYPLRNPLYGKTPSEMNPFEIREL